MADVHSEHSQTIPSGRAIIFWIGVLALFNAGLSAALRAAIAGNLKQAYLDPIDLAQSGSMIAEALGIAFLGFTLMLLVCSAVLDKVGMRRMLLFAASCYIIAAFLLTTCGQIAEGRTVYWLIMAGMLVNGIAHAAVEGTINPMTFALYPDDTTHRMNILHAWWPAGLIVGGLLGAFGSHIGLDWRFVFLTVAVVAVVFGTMTFGREFPLTTSGVLGISAIDQFKEVLRRPSFFIWFFLMLLTSATELAPGQWVDVALTNVVGMRGILLLVYVSGIMFIGRHFAGPLERRFSTEGLLTVSCIFAAIGLYLLASADSPTTALVAATLWGVGVCYLWPTMLAVAGSRFPKGGPVVIALIGVAGSISIYFILPMMGMIYDAAKVEVAGGAEALARLTDEEERAVLVHAAGESFRAVAIIPMVLVVAFGIMWIFRLYGKGVSMPVGEFFDPRDSETSAPGARIDSIRTTPTLQQHEE